MGAESMKQIDCPTGSLLGREESLLAKGERGEQGRLKEAWEVVAHSGK